MVWFFNFYTFAPFLVISHPNSPPLFHHNTNFNCDYLGAWGGEEI